MRSCVAGTYCLCGVGWGIAGKLAEDSEAMRALYGPARYLVSGLKSFVRCLPLPLPLLLPLPLPLHPYLYLYLCLYLCLCLAPSTLHPASTPSPSFPCVV